VNRAHSFPEPKALPAPLAWTPRRLTWFALYLLANLVGAFLIFRVTHSIAQQARQEERNYYDSVDGVTFFCTAGPVFLFCCFVNALWGIKVFIDAFKRRDFRALIALGIVFAVWAADYLAMRIDARIPT
jgi:hypothetical protein